MITGNHFHHHQLLIHSQNPVCHALPTGSIVLVKGGLMMAMQHRVEGKICWTCLSSCTLLLVLLYLVYTAMLPCKCSGV
jgi:hypothetical protein